MKIDNASYVKYDIYVYNLCFSSSKNAENHTVCPKLAWPPATYDVISRNYSNRFSPNSRQNVSKGYA